MEKGTRRLKSDKVKRAYKAPELSRCGHLKQIVQLGSGPENDTLSIASSTTF